MRTGLMLLVLIGLGSLYGRVEAQAKPVVAMIGTGNLANSLGPAIGRAGYPVVYGSRNPDRDLVRALVARTGANASAAGQREATARAMIVVLAVPSEVLDEVTSSIGNLDGKIVVDVSGGRKRVAPDGYLELVSDSANSQRIQSRYPTAHVVRLGLPGIFSFDNPRLLGTPPTVLIAGDDPRARETVARLIFDTGLDPWDAGPLRFSRVFDAIGLLSLIPAQQGRTEGYDLKLLPSVPWSCIFNPAEAFGFGRPYDMGKLPRFPRRDPLVSCDEWLRRLGIGEPKR